MKTESTHLTMKQVRGATKFWALFAKFYDIFLKANDVGELKKLYAKMKTKVNHPKAKEALDFFYRVRRDVILGHIDLNEMKQFLEENKMMNEDKILDDLISSIKKLASIKYMYVNDTYEFTKKDIKNIIEFGITLLKSISSLPQDMQNDLKSMSSRVKNFTNAIKRLKQNKKLSASDDDADYIYVIVDFIKRSLENNNLLKEFSAKAHGDKKQTKKFKSGSSSKTYETVKWADGTYSCNCPGWTRRVNANKERICKHVKEMGGKPYKDVPKNEEKLREVIRGMVREVLSEGSMDKFYNATVKHKKNKLVGDVVRFDSGKLKISITKGPHKGKYILASPSEVDIIKESLSEAVVKGRNNKTGESFAIVIGSEKKDDDGWVSLDIRTGYSSRISEIGWTFDADGNLVRSIDYGFELGGKYPSHGHGSGRTYNKNKKETITILSKQYTPAFAKRVIQHVKQY